MKTLELELTGHIPRNYTGIVKINSRGIKQISTFKNGLHHSYNDEPAYTNVNTNVNSNYRQWYKDGKYHRDNGKPAIIYPDGTHSYYIDDKKVSKESAEIYAMLFKVKN